MLKMIYYTTKTLLAGKPGTSKWVKKYGNALLCVRYKYDLEKKRKLKTVELIIENEPWDISNNRIAWNKIVGIKVTFGEIEIGRLVKNAGGRWDKKTQLWHIPYHEVISLGLVNRIVPLKIEHEVE
jgi:hypothetical protein